MFEYVEPLLIEYVYGGVPFKFCVLIIILPSQPQLGWLTVYDTLDFFSYKYVVQSPELTVTVPSNPYISQLVNGG